MPHMRVQDAADFMGVSDDTVRRWIESGELSSQRDASRRRVVDNYELALFARTHLPSPPSPPGIQGSARNRFTGLVTGIVTSEVMAQVELQCGPYRVVSLISAEAVEALGLELGSLAVAVVKATNVVVESPLGKS